VALLVFLGADLFIGVGFAVGVHIILNSMLSDASEDIAVQSEQRAEGVMFAAYGLLAKWGTGIGAFLAGVLLSVVKFPAKAVPGTVSMDLMRNLVLVNLPTITVFNLAAIVCVSFYALDRTKHEQNLAVLRARTAPAPTSASAG
jgi:Na+/melibiose symporter-like transporter